jgi:hypothetical protein
MSAWEQCEWLGWGPRSSRAEPAVALGTAAPPQMVGGLAADASAALATVPTDALDELAARRKAAVLARGDALEAELEAGPERRPRPSLDAPAGAGEPPPSPLVRRLARAPL